ncbi:MAG: hypothetical protein M3Q69_17325, partial [Acidobacteriota bacterium]|nr:hypothetical protein [Acidobacteriota bacterium]
DFAHETDDAGHPDREGLLHRRAVRRFTVIVPKVRKEGLPPGPPGRSTRVRRLNVRRRDAHPSAHKNAMR